MALNPLQLLGGNYSCNICNGLFAPGAARCNCPAPSSTDMSIGLLGHAMYWAWCRTLASSLQAKKPEPAEQQLSQSSSTASPLAVLSASSSSSSFCKTSSMISSAASRLCTRQQQPNQLQDGQPLPSSVKVC
eukprot:gnl/Hemi2/21730_TR7248_c0_g2_i1.p1 gnl/Hemi2/21730_TR7248_c0_g2~~gnl/Hemi2/21730_TR7248_c0_g2_i1.p1  ORF type:complete len:132 (-),score=14.70 gnl/Hemi2/21730_TR7248_c0_g2_i1:70-465(-)